MLKNQYVFMAWLCENPRTSVSVLLDFEKVVCVLCPCFLDGWEIPEGKSVVAEIYPALWMRRLERDGRDGDEHAAYATAAWLQRADQNGSLGGYLNPPLTQEEREVADIEGWILGVV